jgi:hypothetical protein
VIEASYPASYWHWHQDKLAGEKRFIVQAPIQGRLMDSFNGKLNSVSPFNFKEKEEENRVEQKHPIQELVLKY